MTDIKSHFVFTKQQRSGIFVCILLIALLQCVYVFYPVKPIAELTTQDKESLLSVQKELDSLKAIAKSQKNKTHPFNPNFITDYKGYMLGMSITEIDRLHKYRKQNKYVNSALEFQKITKVSDSLLAALSPNFKFPDWVVKKNKSYNKTAYQRNLNSATAKDIYTATGLSYRKAYRIINFRDQLTGFLSLSQLKDVYNISAEEINIIKSKFELQTIPEIQKININLAPASELASIAYISDYLALNIVDERVLREGFTSLDELRFVYRFPVEKLAHIKLYLTIQ